MGLRTTICHQWWLDGCAAVACCAIVLGCAVQGLAKMTQHKVGVSPWEQATQGREALEAIPEGTRTKADYTRAMDGYRAVYHESPQSSMQRLPLVNGVAELLAEQGRSLQDAKSLKAAVGQYEFLRTQYPGSSLRVGALLAEAQIYQNDLHDAVVARGEVCAAGEAVSAKLAGGRGSGGDGLAGAGDREQGTGNRGQGCRVRWCECLLVTAERGDAVRAEGSVRSLLCR